jgi:1,4-dihydroxy-2-naphthoate octaprenyltransferase
VGWFYTAPPLKLSYRGLSELSALLAVSVFISGMGYFVASGTTGPLFQVFIFARAISMIIPLFSVTAQENIDVRRL